MRKQKRVIKTKLSTMKYRKWRKNIFTYERGGGEYFSAKTCNYNLLTFFYDNGIKYKASSNEKAKKSNIKLSTMQYNKWWNKYCTYPRSIVFLVDSASIFAFVEVQRALPFFSQNYDENNTETETKLVISTFIYFN